MVTLTVARHVGDQHATAGGREQFVHLAGATEFANSRRLVPVTVPNLQVVRAAVVGLENVQVRDVEDDFLTVGGRDSPLAFFRL